MSTELRWEAAGVPVPGPGTYKIPSKGSAWNGLRAPRHGLIHTTLHDAVLRANPRYRAK